jgi:hypothetical protein
MIFFVNGLIALIVICGFWYFWIIPFIVKRPSTVSLVLAFRMLLLGPIERFVSFTLKPILGETRSADSAFKVTAVVGAGLVLSFVILDLLMIERAPEKPGPHWIIHGATGDKENGRSFHGVGTVTGVKNETLAWDTAERRARAEVAKNFETYTSSLMRNYVASTAAGDIAREAAGQNVELAIKSLNATLTAVRPVDRHRDAKTGTYYVLAKLDLQDFKGVVLNSKELRIQVRNFILDNADHVFDELSIRQPS